MTLNAKKHGFGQIDIVVFSRDRNLELRKSLEIWGRQPFNFIILHNSEHSLPTELISKNIVYKHLPGMSYGERAGIASDLIASEFAAILSDDEVLIESGVDVMIKKLDSNLGLASIGGKVLGIHNYGKNTTGAFAYRNMYNYENFESKILNRLERHLVEPISGEMPRASMYRIMRSNHMKSILALFSKVAFVESPYVYEIVGEFAIGAVGPTTTVGSLYWIRNWQNRMVEHKDWNRSLNFIQWWEDSKNAMERQELIQLLSNFASIDPVNTKNIIGRYLTRRSAYESSGNKQASNLRLLLSRIKSEIPGVYSFAKKPKEIFQIIEAENLDGQNAEKEAIARLCCEILDKRG
jgi:hypothetical protein